MKNKKIMKDSMYFTSNQTSTDTHLGTDGSAYKELAALGNRLRAAMGAEEILSRNVYRSNELRIPTFRSYAEATHNNMWTAYNENGNTLHVVPYNGHYDGWIKNRKYHEVGFMAIAVNHYEYAYELWDKWTHQYHPDLFNDSTFGAWLELLPQPVSIVYTRHTVTLRWAAADERVCGSEKMRRYSVPKDEREVITVDSEHWRYARAEAYVQAWEKMAAYESK